MSEVKQWEYYNAPMEIWRDLLRNKTRVTDDVLNYQLAVKIEELTKINPPTNDEEKRGLYFNAMNLCGFTAGNLDVAAERGFYLIGEKYSGVMYSVSYDYFWNFKNDNHSTKWDAVRLLGYMALKSIAGNKAIARTNNKMLFARMACYATTAQYNETNPLGELEPYKHNKSGKCIVDKNGKRVHEWPDDDIRHYMTRYYAGKLRAELEQEFDNFKSDGDHLRGFVFTFKKDVSLVDMIVHAKQNTKTYKDAELNVEKATARLQAAAIIKSKLDAKLNK